MSKPTSLLAWTPDPQLSTSIGAVWRGAPSPYTLYWGDGQQRHMAQHAAPATHDYGQPGTWDVVAVADIHEQWTAASRVTVRPELHPTAELSLVDGRTVRVAIGGDYDPILWRVDWGDGAVTEHGPGDAVEHQYPWDFGDTSVLVTDVPARRSITYPGPAVGPDPTPPEPGDISGWFWHYGGTNRRFVLYGVADPGSTVEWSDWSGNDLRTATADERGRVAIPHDIPTPIWDTMDAWRSYTVRYRRAGATVHTFVPVHVPRAQAGEPDLVYDVDPDDPQRLVFSALPATPGRYRVDFGDGSAEQTIDVTAVPLSVEHTYPGGGPYTARVTMPDGREDFRRISAGDPYPCPPSYNRHYPGRASLIWWYPGMDCGQKMRDPFAPVTMQVTGYWPHRLHCPNNEDGFNAGYGYTFGSTGWKSFRYLGALARWRSESVTIEALEKVKTAQRGYPVRIDPDGPVPPRGVTVDIQTGPPESS